MAASILLSTAVLAACGEAASIPAGVSCETLVYASNDDGDWDIYSLTGARNIQLTDDSANQVNPSWSPDGTRVLFTSIDDGSGDLHAMLKDGSADEALTGGREFESSSDWSPDGSTIVFDRVVEDLADRDEHGFTQLFTAAYGPPLGEAKQLTFGEPNAKPKWSPDGSRIAFLSWRDGNAEIYTMTMTGSDQTNLTKHPGYDVLPAWSPDGSTIAFVSDRDGDNQIYIMGADGSNPTRITKHPHPATNPSWSSDGRHIFFTAEEDKYEIYAIALTGGTATHITSGFTHECQPISP